MQTNSAHMSVGNACCYQAQRTTDELLAELPLHQMTHRSDKEDVDVHCALQSAPQGDMELKVSWLTSNEVTIASLAASIRTFL